MVAGGLHPTRIPLPAVNGLQYRGPMTEVDLQDLLRSQLADCETQWSVGSFGAIAEFSRDEGEPAAVSHSGLSVVTDRGGIRISPLAEIRPVASESVTRESWAHRVALCLPELDGAMARREVLTELGPDEDALRERDCGAVLFDLGLGALQADACIRLSDPAVVAELRAVAGRNVFETGNPAMHIVLAANPHRVFISRIGRVEVFQPIPPPYGRSPEGPHTHVLPKLLQHGRTHAATEHIPQGLVPCAHLYPAHPAKDELGAARPFEEGRHASFQRMLQRFGDGDLVDLKRRVMQAVEQGGNPSAMDVPNDRFSRATIRIALRQLQASRAAPPEIADWIEVYDRSHAADDDAAHHHEHEH